MRQTYDLQQKCHCKDCKFHRTNWSEIPCRGCTYIATNSTSNGMMGTSFVMGQHRSPSKDFLSTQNMVIEQLEFEMALLKENVDGLQKIVRNQKAANIKLMRRVHILEWK